MEENILLIDSLPFEIIYKISTYLDIKKKHNLSLVNKNIYNEIIIEVHEEKYRLIRLKISFIIFKEKILLNQIINFIQSIVRNQLDGNQLDGNQLDGNQLDENQ